MVGKDPLLINICYEYIIIVIQTSCICPCPKIHFFFLLDTTLCEYALWASNIIKTLTRFKMQQNFFTLHNLQLIIDRVANMS
jgi:hypothetical protein